MNGRVLFWSIIALAAAVILGVRVAQNNDLSALLAFVAVSFNAWQAKGEWR